MNRYLASLLIVSTGLGASGRIAHAQDDQRTLRTYDVLSLVRAAPGRSDRIEVKGPLLFRRDDNGRTISFNQAPHTYPAVEGAEPLGVERLVDVVANALSVLFESLDGDIREEYLLMHRGHVLEGTLTETEHEATSYVLNRLRATSEPLFQVECLLVPSEVWSELGGEGDAGGGSTGQIFDRALLDARVRLLSVVTENGRWSSSGAMTRRTVLDDLEVNQTGVIPVVVPVLDDRWEGHRLEVCPLLLGASGGVFVELAVGRYAVDSGKTSFGGQWGQLDSPRQNDLVLSTSLVTRPGQAVVAGRLDVGGGFVAVVRVTRTAERSSGDPPRSGNRVLEVYDTTALLRIVPRAFLNYREDPEPWTDDDIAHRLDREFGEAADEEIFLFEVVGDNLMIIATPGVHRRLGSLLERELARLSRMARIELEILEIPRETYGKLQGFLQDLAVLEDGWQAILPSQNIEREHYRLSGATTQIHGLRSVSWGSLVTSLDEVSGGTGFAIIQVADPVVQDGGSGSQFRVQAEFTGDGSHARLRLRGERARLLEKRRVTARYPAISVMSGESGGPGTVTQEVELTLPRQEAVHWDIHRTLPVGRWSILHRDAKAGEGVQLVVGRVVRE